MRARNKQEKATMKTNKWSENRKTKTDVEGPHSFDNIIRLYNVLGFEMTGPRSYCNGGLRKCAFHFFIFL